MMITMVIGGKRELKREQGCRRPPDGLRGCVLQELSFLQTQTHNCVLQQLSLGAQLQTQKIGAQ